ncbi:MAG: histidine kinase [Gemmataceae bacterium]|nr:histidine kinase [Gemmataceae bacterium]MCI0737908.1 histidine kinase [Gemmataceae bacterium]
MAPRSFSSRIWITPAVVFGVWFALAVFLTGNSYLLVRAAIRAQADVTHPSGPPPIEELFFNNLAVCLLWALFTMGVFWLCRHFPFGQGRTLRNLAVHVVACLVFAFLQTVALVYALEFIRQDIPRPTITANVLEYFFLANSQQNVFFYWTILAVSHVLQYYRRFREREIRSSQLEAKLAQTQLQILKMQLHPHFLFNTLNAISALIHQDVELADRMIARLGDLLRATLENASKQEVPLKEELDFIEPYLEIEKARLGDRLNVKMSIDPAALGAQVPNLILQPLVENAIRHGIAARAEPGRIDIEARRDNGALHLAVTDDGPGLKSPSPASQGIGLANTQARLEKLFGAEQRFELSNGPGRGFRVGITIPFRESAAEAS